MPAGRSAIGRRAQLGSAQMKRTGAHTGGRQKNLGYQKCDRVAAAVKSKSTQLIITGPGARTRSEATRGVDPEVNEQGAGPWAGPPCPSGTGGHHANR